VHSLASVRSCAYSWIANTSYKLPAEVTSRVLALLQLAVSALGIYLAYQGMAVVKPVSSMSPHMRPHRCNSRTLPSTHSVRHETRHFTSCLHYPQLLAATSHCTCLSGDAVPGHYLQPRLAHVCIPGVHRAAGNQWQLPHGL
jgi:hypothetical protein